MCAAPTNRDARKWQNSVVAAIVYVAALIWTVYVFHKSLPKLDCQTFQEIYNSLAGVVLGFGIPDIFLVLWVWILAYLVGQAFLDFWGIEYDSVPERIALSSGAGVVLVTSLIFLLAAVRLLYSQVAYGLLILSTIIYFQRLHSIVAETWTTLTSQPMFRRITLASSSRAFLWFYITVVLVIVLLSAVEPENEYDPILYHLPIAKVMAQTHRLKPLRDVSQSFFPKNVALLFSLGMLLHSEITAKLIHYWLGLLAMISAYAFSLRLGSRTAALLSSAILASTPIFIWEMRTAHIDLGLALSVFLSLYATIVWLQTGRKPWFILSVLFTAWSLGTKYHALFSLGSLSLLIFLYLLRECWDVRFSFRQATKFFLLSSIGLLPWGILNLLQTGNPVFPFLNGIFKSPYWNNDLMNAALSQSQRITLSNWRSAFSFPWQMVGTEPGNEWGGNIGPFYLMAIPLLVLVRRARREIYMIVLFASFFTVFWLFTGEHARYYLGALVGLAVVAAYAISECMKRLQTAVHSIGSGVAAGILLVMLLLNSPFFEGYGAFSRYGNSPMGSISFPYLLGQETRDHYLEHLTPQYAAVEYLNRIPGHKKVLFWWNTAPMSLYLDGESASVWSYYFNQLMGDDSSRLHRVLLDHGITHVVVGQSGQSLSFFSNPEKELVQRYLRKIYEKNAMTLYEVSSQPLAQEVVAYDFLDHIAEAKIKMPAEPRHASQDDYAQVVSVGDDFRYSLWTHPPADAKFSLSLPEAPVLKFAIGRRWPPCLGQGSFQVWVTSADNGRTEMLFDREIHEQNPAYEVGWFPERLDLQSYAGQHVTLTFKTLAPDTRTCGWLLWATPQILARSSPE